MDSDTEKLCLEEIDHLVLDAGKKVDLRVIANNWNATFKDGEAVLEKWLDKYADDRKIVKEYLIRGMDTNGNVCITVVSDKHLRNVEKKCPKHTKTLYSIEVASETGRTLDIVEPSTNQFISLILKSEKRKVKVNKPLEQVKKEPAPQKKPANSFFGAATSKPKASTESAAPVKQEPISPKKQSPKKESPKKNHDKPKAQQGKSSIATFFSAKSGTSTAKASTSVAQATTDIKNIKIKEENTSEAAEVKDEKVEVKSEKKVEGVKSKATEKPTPSARDKNSSAKRSHPNASDSNEEANSPANKKSKMEKVPARSRLMQICDSSDEEGTPFEPVPVKKEKENKTPSPQKIEANASKVSGNTSGKRRIKVKKTVTNTYEDEDGFINTVRETIEVSESDDEVEITKEEPAKKSIHSSSSTSSSATAASKKKVSPPNAGKKQGSILSFFGKK